MLTCPAYSASDARGVYLTMSCMSSNQAIRSNLGASELQGLLREVEAVLDDDAQVVWVCVYVCWDVW